MQIKNFVLSSILTSAARSAQLTNKNFHGIYSGKPFTVTWSDASGDVTLSLKVGDTVDYMKWNGNIATVTNATSYQWTPDQSLPMNIYALQIDDETGTQYSPQFQLIVSTTTTAASATSSTATLQGTPYP